MLIQNAKLDFCILSCFEMIPTTTTTAAEASAWWETKYWVQWHADGHLDDNSRCRWCVCEMCYQLNEDKFFLEKQTLLQWPGLVISRHELTLWSMHMNRSINRSREVQKGYPSHYMTIDNILEEISYFIYPFDILGIHKGIWGVFAQIQCIHQVRNRPTHPVQAHHQW